MAMGRQLQKRSVTGAARAPACWAACCPPASGPPAGGPRATAQRQRAGEGAPPGGTRPGGDPSPTGLLSSTLDVPPVSTASTRSAAAACACRRSRGRRQPEPAWAQRWPGCQDQSRPEPAYRHAAPGRPSPVQHVRARRREPTPAAGAGQSPWPRRAAAHPTGAPRCPDGTACRVRLSQSASGKPSSAEGTGRRCQAPHERARARQGRAEGRGGLPAWPRRRGGQRRQVPPR